MYEILFLMNITGILENEDWLLDLTLMFKYILNLIPFQKENKIRLAPFKTMQSILFQMLNINLLIYQSYFLRIIYL